MKARNALLEAEKMVGAGYEPRVLEPSPPAVTDGVWFADDPAVGGNLDWNQWAKANPQHTNWAAERWLAAYRRLGSLPPTFLDTRLALHRFVVYVVSPARQRATAKMALRWTLGGLGTPFFGDDEQVRIAEVELVRQHGSQASAEPITSLTQAARFVLGGAPEGDWAKKLDVPPLGDPDADLSIDRDAAGVLADWYGFAWSVLEELRAERSSTEPSRVQLWPEHFDAAFDCLPPDRRATFGASPGDHAYPEPYLYVVSAGVERTPSPLWNAGAFLVPCSPTRSFSAPWTSGPQPWTFSGPGGTCSAHDHLDRHHSPGPDVAVPGGHDSADRRVMPTIERGQEAPCRRTGSP